MGGTGEGRARDVRGAGRAHAGAWRIRAGAASMIKTVATAQTRWTEMSQNETADFAGNLLPST